VSNKTEPNEPAFTLSHPECGYHLGLTKREYFAGLALQGLLASGYWMSTGYDDGHTRQERAEVAVGQADALTEALNKEQAE